MREFKSGTLRSGSKKGPVVKGKKQAIAKCKLVDFRVSVNSVNASTV